MKSNVRWKPIRKSQKCNSAKRLAIHPSRHLREPIIKSAERSEEDAADNHVVKMRNHEIGIGQAAR